MIHRQIIVKGKVQGVFFRASTRDKAKELDLRGTVRNLPDGSVFIEAEGDESGVAELVKWCHKGPQRAEVSEVSVKESQVTGLSDFKIVR